MFGIGFVEADTAKPGVPWLACRQRRMLQRPAASTAFPSTCSRARLGSRDFLNLRKRQTVSPGRLSMTLNAACISAQLPDKREELTVHKSRQLGRLLKVKRLFQCLSQSVSLATLTCVATNGHCCVVFDLKRASSLISLLYSSFVGTHVARSCVTLIADENKIRHGCSIFLHLTRYNVQPHFRLLGLITE